MSSVNQFQRALAVKYPEPDWILVWEVANGTGSNKRRTADGVAFCMYPSRGMPIHGFEHKVSKSDLVKELEQPAKAEAVAKYCDQWWLVTPPGLTADVDIPKPWGVYEVDDQGQLKIAKKAVTLPDQVPCTLTFFGSVLRAAIKNRVLRSDIQPQLEAVRQSAAGHAQFVLRRYEQELRDLKDLHGRLEKACGGSIGSWQVDQVVRMLRIARQNSRRVDDVTQVKRLADDLRGLAARVEAITAVMDDDNAHAPQDYPAGVD